jgi:hypothetical protein
MEFPMLRNLNKEQRGRLSHAEACARKSVSAIRWAAVNNRRIEDVIV